MMREVIARATYIAHHKNGPTEDALSEPNMGRGGFKTEVVTWNAVAQAALDAISEAGFVIVPKEPTEAMVRVGMADGDWPHAAETYRAMIEASQESE